MDVNGNVGCLTRTIADSEIQSLLDETIGTFRSLAAELLEKFAGGSPTAQKTNDLESNLHEQLRQLGRRLIQAIFSLLQPESVDMPAAVSFRGHSHRRLQGTTVRRNILTRFGNVSLPRARAIDVAVAVARFSVGDPAGPRKRIHPGGRQSGRPARRLWEFPGTHPRNDCRSDGNQNRH